MIKIFENEKFLLGYDLVKEKEFNSLNYNSDDYVLITTKRIVKRIQSNFKWEYQILLIDDIKNIKISKGFNASKLLLSILGFISYFPLMNLLENEIINTILALSSIVFGLILLINQFFFMDHISLSINSNEKIKLNFSKYNLFYNKLIEKISQ
tara:strand:- start:9271 stop:9729 length:459 start_codon:yes stop_codon:yes gene_type:complete